MPQQSSRSQASIQKVDPVWAKIRDEAEDVARLEPQIGTFIYSSILHHDTLEAAVVHRVSERLDHADVQAELIRQAYPTRWRTSRSWARRSAPTSLRCSTATRRPIDSSSQC